MIKICTKLKIRTTGYNQDYVFVFYFSDYKRKENYKRKFQEGIIVTEEEAAKIIQTNPRRNDKLKCGWKKEKSRHLTSNSGQIRRILEVTQVT